MFLPINWSSSGPIILWSFQRAVRIWASHMKALGIPKRAHCSLETSQYNRTWGWPINRSKHVVQSSSNKNCCADVDNWLLSVHQSNESVIHKASLHVRSTGSCTWLTAQTKYAQRPWSLGEDMPFCLWHKIICFVTTNPNHEYFLSYVTTSM